MTKRFLVLVAVLATAMLPVSPAFAASPPAIKLPGSYADAGLWASGGPQGWASTAISDASLWGVIQGYPSGDFEPSGNITRAEFAKMLAVAMGDASPDPAQMGNMTTTETIFSDTPAQSWYAPYVQALSANPGGNPSANVLTTTMYPTKALGPGQPITRAEAAAWIARALAYFNVPPTEAQQAQVKQFPDVPTGNWTYTFNGTATSATYDVTIPGAEIDGMSAYGIVTGYPDGTFQPDGFITRAEAAAMLTRFIQALPGYSALARQTPWIGAEATTYCDYIKGGAWIVGSSSPSFGTSKNCGLTNNAANGYPYGQPATVLTSADLGFTPASTGAAFTAEPTATWQQVHEWIATQNWLALGEAKLNTDEAGYVAGYGLQPYAVAEVVVGANYYADFNLGTFSYPLLMDLFPSDTAIGPQAVAPVSSIQLNCPDAPWLGGLPTINEQSTLQFTVNGAAGVFGGNVDIRQGDGNPNISAAVRTTENFEVVDVQNYNS